MTATGSVSVGRRVDLAAVLGSMAVITAIAWALTVDLAAGMAMPPGGMEAMPGVGPPAADVLVVTAMWAAMMVGMMVPTATPMVLAHSSWTRSGGAGGRRLAVTAAFLSGYVVVWLGFSVLAALLQLGLQQLGVLDAMGATGPGVGGGVLVAAGVFQLTGAKEACLSRCRTPTGFLIAEWRDGVRGGLVMGLRHGRYCLGCCWALMVVLFVVGTMHLGWMAAVALFVLVEKVAPAVLRVRHAAGVGLIVWGAVALLGIAA
jgi:predicted metal-binding membrane protein